MTCCTFLLTCLSGLDALVHGFCVQHVNGNRNRFRAAWQGHIPDKASWILPHAAALHGLLAEGMSQAQPKTCRFICFRRASVI